MIKSNSKLSKVGECEASIAQWLEHWSCKPGVMSSNLIRGYL